MQHFVFFSSSMVYGNFHGRGGRPRTSRCEPIGIYGALKLGGEKLVIAYNQVFDLPYTIVRPSALYGQRCVSRRVGQVFIENALAASTLRVDGDGDETASTSPTSTTSSTASSSAIASTEGARNEIFNLTYGRRALAQRDLVDARAASTSRRSRSSTSSATR